MKGFIDCSNTYWESYYKGYDTFAVEADRKDGDSKFTVTLTKDRGKEVIITYNASEEWINEFVEVLNKLER